MLHANLLVKTAESETLKASPGLRLVGLVDFLRPYYAGTFLTAALAQAANLSIGSAFNMRPSRRSIFIRSGMEHIALANPAHVCLSQGD